MGLENKLTLKITDDAANGRSCRKSRTKLIYQVYEVDPLKCPKCGAQPDKFKSIFEAIWWGAVTLTTVGHGDIYPITPFGKFLASIFSLLGIGLFAMPAGILSAGFVEEIRTKKLARDKSLIVGLERMKKKR